jgi:hypothetical protein
MVALPFVGSSPPRARLPANLGDKQDGATKSTPLF